MKNKPIKAAVTVFLFIFILSGCDFMHEFPFSKAPLPFDGDICFTRKLSKFKEKYGEPTETEDRSALSSSVIYIYEQEMFGKRATVEYEFGEVLMTSELIGVYAVIDPITEDEAKEIIKTLALNFKDSASSLKGYYNSADTSGNRSYCNFGAGSGAEGLTFGLWFENGTLIIDGKAIY